MVGAHGFRVRLGLTEPLGGAGILLRLGHGLDSICCASSSTPRRTASKHLPAQMGAS